jgi:hypothetical protein
MINRIAIHDIVAAIDESNSATLFLDTCAILDIIRALSRSSSDELCAAKMFCDKRDAQAIHCEVVLPSVVHQEYIDNFGDTSKLLDRFFQQVSDIQHELSKAQLAFGRSATPCYSDAPVLSERIIRLTHRIVNTATHVKEQDDLHAAASKRIVQCRPPATKGKQELKDCLIVEECLEICRQLKRNGSRAQLYFLSSNTKDFCIAETKTIRQELAHEFSQYGLEYCYSWKQILAMFT